MPALELDQAARAVKAGGIVAYPTEAVFGLGCDPYNQDAVERLLELKGRPVSKGLIVLVSDKEQMLKQLQPMLAEEQLAELDREWPGAKTYLLPLAEHFPRWIAGDHKSVAVRVTAHPLAAELTSLCGGYLVSTSANVAGQNPAKTTLEVRQAFQSELDYILAGETGGLEKPTPIIDMISGQKVRD